MDLKEFIRQNEKMNSSLITDWSKDMLLEAMQIYADDQLRLQRQDLMSILTIRVLKIQSEPNGIVRETMINDLLVDINYKHN